MLLSELLRDVEYSGTIKDMEIKNVTCDSRQVEPGSVFVCVKAAQATVTNMPVRQNAAELRGLLRNAIPELRSRCWCRIPERHTLLCAQT